MPRHLRGLCLALAALLAMPVPTASAAPAPQVHNLRTNALTDPLGIAAGPPRLSWQLDSSSRGVTQTRYQVRVATSPSRLSRPDAWDSGVVHSDRSVDVEYAGTALKPYTQYFWAVRVWDGNGRATRWSDPATFETAQLKPSDWTGQWIGAASQPGPEWTDYTVDADVTVVKEALGVFFRGRSGIGYMWQLNSINGAKLRPHVRQPGGGYVVLGEIPLNVDLSQRHHLRITVAGKTITTWIDGTQVDQRERTDHNAAGVVGFRTNGAESGVVHNLVVTNAAGTKLIDTAFASGDQTFPDGTVLPGGGLQVKGNTDLWLPGPPLPVFRRTVTIPAGKKVVRARMYAAAQGIYELSLNGKKVGDQELAPGWTDYRLRIQSQAYDVTRQLRPGQNVLGAELATGWFAGNVAMFGSQKYGSETALTAQLRVTYSDGTTDVIGTDQTWQTAPGAVRVADLLNGESYDARRTATEWTPALLRPSATAQLVPQTDQPVRVTQHLAAKAIASPTPGKYLYDLGQNMVGVGRFKLTGQPGQTVTIRYGEVLNPDGTLYTDNLRGAKATDHYTFATNQPETYQPRFTFHGFRYVELSAPADAVTGVVMGTDGAQTSRFRTNSTLVNQLHSNIVWGQRGNFLSIPTDTPARDERMGWTGDINVFARTAVYNLDSQAFLTKWLQDLRDSQAADGSYPSVAPTVPDSFDGGLGNAGWADAGVNVPWTLWQAYGDTNVIRSHYASMARYVDYLASHSPGLIRGGGDYGDWLNLDDPTPGDLIGTAFMAKGARQLSQMAAAIGNSADETKYRKLYDDVRAAWIARFVAADGKVGSDSQTGYILGFTNDLIPDVTKSGEHFANTILRRDTHLSTGFLGVDGLLPVLTKVGRSDLAYKLLQNTSYPSWGYEIGWGATTVWERWNSINPDGTFNDVGMNSFNHYAYGAVGEWMYGTLAGVSAAEPGYRKILIAPKPGAGITRSDFALETPYGEVVSNWKTTARGFELDVTVPANTTAIIRLPDSTGDLNVASGTYRFVVPAG
ncbi:alpha-L-rhamnosidase [Kribbella albertanoniae]|uniref:alpha-L-rhamnosidase n=1 Tax=Kribbella albertanoniae TaxID=1266829 RepID=A0A4V2XRX4_9ACTN|nr:alpha-L-rhamnosidase [Kribbella albertanoniae]